MINFIKLFIIVPFLFAADPYYVIVKMYDAENRNALLNTTVFTYERETQRDSAFEQTISYYQQTTESIGAYTFIDTTQNALIIVDWK